MSVRPASRMPRAISLGVLRRSRALDQGDHAVEEALARLLGDLDDDPVGEHAGAAGDRAAVAAGLADHRRRLAGDGRLVDRGDALDHGAVAGDQLARLDDHDVAAVQLARPASRRRRAGAPPSRCASPAARRPGPCRGPRPAPRRGWRRPRSATARRPTVKVNQAGSSPPPSGSPPKTWISQPTVVISAPISTTNITGLRTWSAGRACAEAAREATARLERERAGWSVIGPPCRARG